GLGKDSTQINQMINAVIADSVQIYSCTFRQANSAQALIQGIDYREFLIDQTNFTDITGGMGGALYLTDMRQDFERIYQITGNRFESCVASQLGAITILTSRSHNRLQINNNHIISCSGDTTGGIYLNYQDYDMFELSGNSFQSNQSPGQESNYGCDGYIQNRNILNVQDGVQYYRNAFTGSTTNNPYSVYYSYQIQGGSNSGYLNLRSTSGQCWDSQYESGGNNDGCAFVPTVLNSKSILKILSIPIFNQIVVAGEKSLSTCYQFARVISQASGHNYQRAVAIVMQGPPDVTLNEQGTFADF
ncbi:MAG: hypothetical protein EZS28_041109, partial [Streblomastix strix]